MLCAPLSYSNYTFYVTVSLSPTGGSAAAVSIDIEQEILDGGTAPASPTMSDEELLRAAFPRVPVWPVLVSGVVAFAVAVAASVQAYGGGVAFGPWQGAYLDADLPYRAPLLSVWFARAFVAIPYFDRAACTVLASAAAGALACGALAALAAQALRSRASAPVAAVCGSAAGSILAMTPAWLRLSTGASPAPLTVLLALTGLASLHHAGYRTAPRWLVYAGACTGLAAANDPSFAIVFLIALLAALGELGDRVHVARIFALMLGGFAAAACIPAVYALATGEPLAGFLAHVLYTAFPAIGDGAPQFGFGPSLRAQFAWPVLGAAVVGLTALFVRDLRGAAIAWAIVFLAMGPFWPALTNQQRSAYVLCDTDAAAAMAQAAVCVAAGWGIAWVVRIAPGMRHRTAPAVAASLLLAGTLTTLEYRALPARGAVPAELLGRAILEDCGPDAALVVGNARTASLLRTLQIASGVRPDVAVIPVHALERPASRERLARTYAGALRVPTDFPSAEAWKRWPLERPNEFALLNVQMKMGGLRESDFMDLIVWEFMRANFVQRPICFAGLSPAWLTARGEREGLVLQFPRDGATASRPVDSVIPALADAQRLDPELTKTVVGLLLPLAEASRRQDDAAESARIADRARAYGPDDADTWLVAVRAAARAGQRERATELTAGYIRLAPSTQDMQTILDLVAEDLQRNALAAEFGSAIAAVEGPGAAQERRADLAARLWDYDELAVLANAYARSIEKGASLDDLYEGAAAAAQLGDLHTARDRLGEVVKIEPMTIWDRLQTDGRFLLLEADPAFYTNAPPGIRG